MSNQEEKEERNKRIGWLTSISVQLVLLIICYLIVAWKEPYPPIPEYGIELSFSSSAGAPAVQESREPEESSSSDEQQSDQQNDVQEESTEETIEEAASQPEASEAAEEASEPEVTEEVEQESEVPVESESKPSGAAKDPVKEADEAKTSDTEQEPLEEQKVESRAVMGSGQNKDSGQQVGQKESESNELDARALYGSGGTDAGSKEGANLALAGWKWNSEPKPDDNSPATGRVTYKIKVDSDGHLTSIQLETSSLPPSVERKYREAVLKLTFTKTAEYKAAEFSEGTITFIITSK